MAKFKEKVKHSEEALARLVNDDKISNCDIVSNEIIEEAPDVFGYIKEEKDAGEDVSESYEEVEFLDFSGQGESMTGVQIMTIDKCDDDEFIDIIEECSLIESDLVAISEDNEIENFSIRNNGKVCTKFKH